MKKILATFMVGLLVLAGCGSNNSDTQTPEATAKLKVGTGIVSNVTSENATADKNGKFETNVTYATVVLEGDTIKDVRIDAAQNSLVVTPTAVEAFVAKKTKKELGLDYGLNWSEQVDALQNWMIGKTLAEVKGIKTAEQDGRPAVPTEEDLKSTVSISIQDFIQVVEKAANNAVDVENLATLGTVSDVSSSKAEQGDFPYDITTTVAATGLDKDGKVVYSYIDEAKLTANIVDGTVTDSGQLATKAELKMDYGLNWFEQVAAIQDWAQGKTLDEIKKVQTGADINTTVSIQVPVLLATVEKSIGAATAIR